MSTVLRDMRLEAAGYQSMELGAPWRIAFRQHGLRSIHIVLEGRCELALDNGSVETLETGDLVVTPRADPYELRSTGAVNTPLVAACDLVTGADGIRIHHGGTGENVRVLSGGFLFHESDEAMLAALPRVIRLPGNEGRVLDWLLPYIDALTNEATVARAGADIVMTRLTDALVAGALRHYAEGTDTTGWLRGLGDVHLAKALAVIHGDYGRPWTLAELARISGLSRTTFAQRFNETVGEPPMQYLTAVRVRRAIRMLTRENATLARVAETVGYSSEAAFSNAFKRETGEAPGAYRKGSAQERTTARRHALTAA